MLRLSGVSWACTPTRGRPPFFLEWSFEDQFRVYVRWILLMGRVGTLSGAVITDKTTKLKIRISMWPTDA